MSAQWCAHFFVCGALAGRMMDPSVRARRLRRSPTEGTPLGVSVDSRCRVPLMAHSFFCMWRPCRADDGPVGSREAFTPKPNRGDPFRGVG